MCSLLMTVARGTYKDSVASLSPENGTVMALALKIQE